jgi:adenylate cyclase class 2
MKNQELEVKFHIADLSILGQRLTDLGASLSHPRVHEVNLRFDTPDGSLGRASRVLRLRKDDAARLTFKGPSLYQQGVTARQEVEFAVSDFDAARLFLEALGYQVSMMYEKYRTTYAVDQMHITLDEMPYGDFVEIEGGDTAKIHRISVLLELAWALRVPDSYTVIFERLLKEYHLSFRDLSFENFRNLNVSLEKIGIHPAD